MDDPFSQVRVGVGVMLVREGTVLLGTRIGAHGAGQPSFPGGHLEKGESVVDCARREVREEAGLEVANVRFQYAARSSLFLPRDYLHIGTVADWTAGEPRLMEPEKCTGWTWCRLSQLPTREMFVFAALAVDALNTGRVFYDADDVAAFDRRRKG